MQIINEGLLKKRITYIIAICRLLILILLFALYYFGRLIETQLYQLLFCTLPNSTLYLVFIIKYTVNTKRYIYPGKIISRIYFTTSYLPLLLLHVIEFTLILFNQYFFETDIAPLYWWVLGTECLLAAYAGFYLSGLFSNQPIRQEN